MIVINVMEENKIIANPWIFLTDIPKEWRIRRFIESSPEALRRAEDKNVNGVSIFDTEASKKLKNRKYEVFLIQV